MTTASLHSCLLRVGEASFRWRSWTPIPLALWLVAFARPRRGRVLGGLLLVLVGFLFRLWSVVHIGPESRSRREGPSHRASGGPYALLDHPLYVANGILSEGLATMSGAGWPRMQIVFPLIWLLYYGPIMLWEEACLRRRFGSEERPPIRRAESPDWRTAWRSERRTRQSVAAFLVAVSCTTLYRLLGRRSASKTPS